MNIWRVGWAIAFCQLLTALTLSGVFWAPWTWFEMVNLTILVKSLMFVASILFIALPIFAVIGLWQRHVSGFYAMSVFPVVAFIFGTVPLPYVSGLYTSDVSVNNLAIAFVNMIAIVVGVALLSKCQKQSSTTQLTPPE